LLQMVNHCIAEYSNNIKLLKVSVIEKEEGFSLDLNISVEYSMNSPDTIKTIQKIVKDKIEQFTGIPIIKVNVQIVKSHYE